MLKNKILRSVMPAFSVFRMLFDIVVIFTCFYITNYLFYNYEPQIDIAICLAVIILFLFIANTRDFYYSLFSYKLKESFNNLLKIWCISFWATSILCKIAINCSVSYRILIFWFITTISIFYISHLLFKFGLKGSLKHKVYNVTFIGSRSQRRLLALNLKKIPWIKYNIINYYDESISSFNDAKCRGNFQQLIDDAKKGLFDQIYITDSIEQHKNIIDLVQKLADTTCSVMFLPDIFTFDLLRSRIFTINNIPVVSIYDTPLKGFNCLLKRFEDIIGSIIILTLISPVLITLAILVKLTSKGPILFKQDRYGINGNTIKVWKFRSMKVMENDNKLKQATKNDPRLTKIGGFLRKTSLDELPQFFNVLMGNMSIVGPRPHAVVHNEQYRTEILGYMLRHKVKPGITGWAQINGYRGETETLDKMEKRIRYDLEYIRNWSLIFDIKIILLTIVKGFISKTAY